MQVPNVLSQTTHVPATLRETLPDGTQGYHSWPVYGVPANWREGWLCTRWGISCLQSPHLSLFFPPSHSTGHVSDLPGRTTWRPWSSIRNSEIKPTLSLHQPHTQLLHLPQTTSVTLPQPPLPSHALSMVGVTAAPLSKNSNGPFFYFCSPPHTSACCRSSRHLSSRSSKTEKLLPLRWGKKQSRESLFKSCVRQWQAGLTSKFTFYFIQDSPAAITWLPWGW